jgi:hypothetical protein
MSCGSLKDSLVYEQDIYFLFIRHFSIPNKSYLPTFLPSVPEKASSGIIFHSFLPVITIVHQLPVLLTYQQNVCMYVLYVDP